MHMGAKGLTVSRWENKYVIGLTGNIAVGKSLVRQMLQHLGAYTIDADELTHQVMTPGAPAHQPVIEMFGKWLLDDQQRINRTALGSVVFNHPDALAKLEGIIHPIVQQFSSVLITRAKQRVIVIEAIKLLEGSFASAVDAVWVVDAPVDQQVKRLMEKRKMPLEEARKRIGVQNAQADKLARATLVIRNGGTPDDTWKQVQAGWNQVLRATGQAPAPEAAPVVVQPPRPAPAPAPVAPGPSPTAANGGQRGEARPAAAPPAPQAARPSPQPQAPTPPTLPVRPPGMTLAAQTPPPASGIRPLTQQTPAAQTPPMAPPPALANDIHVRRGMPDHAEAIANFITRSSGKPTDRMNVMLTFGQKSYMLAESKSAGLLGVIGFQVENLITRIDELYVDPSAPREPMLRALLVAVEEASASLQSELSLIFLPITSPQEWGRAILNGGYQLLNLDRVRVPAWREAAHELMSDDLVGFMKPLGERVIDPI